MLLSFIWLLCSLSFTTFVEALGLPACSGIIPAALASNLKNYKPAQTFCSSSYPIAITTITKIYPAKLVTTAILTTATITSSTTTITETAPATTATLTESDTITSLNIATITLTSTSIETDTLTTTVYNNSTVTNFATRNWNVTATIARNATFWTNATAYNTIFSTQTVTTITSTVTQTAAARKRDLVQDQVFSSLLAQTNNGSAMLGPMCACMGKTSTMINSIMSTNTMTTLSTATEFVIATETSTVTPMVNSTLTAFTTLASSISTYTTVTLNSTTVITAVQTSTTTVTQTTTMDVTSTFTNFQTSTETDTVTITSPITSVIHETAYTTITVTTPPPAASPNLDLSSCNMVNNPAINVTVAPGKAYSGLRLQYQSFYSGSGKLTDPATDSGNTSPKNYAPLYTYYPKTVSACQAIQNCANAAANDPNVYLSFDLHFWSNTQVWQCIQYYDPSKHSDYWVVDPNIAVAYGWSYTGTVS